MCISPNTRKFRSSDQCSGLIVHRIFIDTEMIQNIYSEDTTKLENLATESILDELRRASALANVGPTTLRGPFQVATLLTPVCLFLRFQMIKKSFNRRTVLDYAAKMGPHKPELLLRVEDLILDTVFELSRGQTSPYQALEALVQNIPWSELQMASTMTRQREWFTSSISKHHCIWLIYTPMAPFNLLLV